MDIEDIVKSKKTEIVLYRNVLNLEEVDKACDLGD